MKLMLPEPGSAVLVPLFDAPQRYKKASPEDPFEDETEEAFSARLAAYERARGVRIRVRLFPADKSRAFRARAQNVAQQEYLRLHELRKTYSREAYPELYQPGFATGEGRADLATLNRDILKAGLVGIEGVLLGTAEGAEPIDSASITDPDRLIQILELAAWDVRASGRVMESQIAKPQERV